MTLHIPSAKQTNKVCTAALTLMRAALAMANEMRNAVRDHKVALAME